MGAYVNAARYCFKTQDFDCWTGLAGVTLFVLIHLVGPKRPAVTCSNISTAITTCAAFGSGCVSSGIARVVQTVAARLPERLFECGRGTVDCVCSRALLSLANVLLAFLYCQDEVKTSASVVAAGSAASGGVTAEVMTVSWLGPGRAGPASTTEYVSLAGGLSGLQPMEGRLVGLVNSISASPCSEYWSVSAWRVAAARLAAPPCWGSVCFWLPRLPRLRFGFWLLRLPRLPRLCFGFGFGCGFRLCSRAVVFTLKRGWRRHTTQSKCCWSNLLLTNFCWMCLVCSSQTSTTDQKVCSTSCCRGTFPPMERSPASERGVFGLQRCLLTKCRCPLGASGEVLGPHHKRRAY